MARFIWTPSYDSDRALDIKLSETPMEGYKQEVPIGLNFIGKQFNLVWTNCPLSDAIAIDGFLRARYTSNGLEPFQWVDLDGEDLWFKCKDWRVTYQSATTRQISARFDQWFGGAIT